jgi:cold shock CspA family protein
VPSGGGSWDNNNSTSSKFGFGGSSRNRSSSSAFDFGGDTSSRLNSRGQDPNSGEKSFDFNTGLTSSGTDNLFSSSRTRFDSNKKRQTGSVKRWNSERGFGFIRRSDGGPDLFCHVRSVRDGARTLEEVNSQELTSSKRNKCFLFTGSNS